VVGILAAGVAVSLVIVGVWAEIDEDTFWETTTTFIVLSIALAHACLLSLPDMAEVYRWIQPASAILIGLLALQVVVAVWGEIEDENYYRMMAAVSVLVVLATLVVPICSRLGSGNDEGHPEHAPDIEVFHHLPEQLVLHRLSGAIFADPLGRRYQVTEIPPGTLHRPGRGRPE
jgi:hypothetical protein